MKLSVWLIRTLLLAFPFAINGAVLKSDTVNSTSLEDPGCSPGKSRPFNIMYFLTCSTDYCLFWPSLISPSREHQVQEVVYGSLSLNVARSMRDTFIYSMFLLCWLARPEHWGSVEAMACLCLNIERCIEHTSIRMRRSSSVPNIRVLCHLGCPLLFWLLDACYLE